MQKICLFAVLILCTLSCEKESIQNINEEEIYYEPKTQTSFDKNDHTPEEGREYATAELFKFCQVLNFLIDKDPNIRTIIYEEVDKMFDGDFNTLLLTVIDRIGYVQFSLAANILFNGNPKSRNLDDKIPQQMLEAFKDIVGETYYPQVFIPFYDDLKESKQLGLRKPYFIPYPSDDGSSILEGYRFNPNNIVKRKIDEKFASKNEVWVLSLNEIVDSNGDLPQPTNTKNTSRDPAISTTVDFMICKSHKESWGSGASEVAHRSLRTTVNGWNNNPYTPGSYIVEASLTSSLRGTLIYEFSRKAVKNHWDKYPNVLLPSESHWHVSNYLAHAHVVPFVIFEADNWPTGTRTNVEILPEGHDVSGVDGDINRYLTYRSADPDYDRGVYYGNNSTSIGAQLYIDGRHVNQSDIEYTIND